MKFNGGTPQQPNKTISERMRMSDLNYDLAYLQAHLLRLDMPLRLAVRRARQAGFDPNNDFQGLYISETELDRYLELAPGAGLWDTQLPLPEFDDAYRTRYGEIISHIQSVEADAERAGHRLRLRHIARQLNLTADDMDILLLCVASAIDRRYERLFGYLQDDITKRDPSVYLVINLLGQTIEQRQRIQHRLVPDAPLQQYALIQPFTEGTTPDVPFIRQMLRADSRVVSYLQGIDTIPAAWQSFVRCYDSEMTLDDLILDDTLRNSLRHQSRDPYAFFYFSGGYGSGKRSIARAVAYENGYPLVEVDLQALKQTQLPRDVTIHDLLTVATREAVLRQAVLLVTNWEALLDDDKRPPLRLWESILSHPYPVVLSSHQPWEAFGTHRQRPMLRLNLDVPVYQARCQHWEFYLQDTGINPAELAYKFKLTGGQIRDAINTAYDLAAWRGELAPTLDDLYAGSRAQSNRNLSELAIKITPRYTWDKIILPPDPMQQLHEIADRLKHAIQVYEEWGFEGGIARGLTVLFAGQSGTGKTMAAEVLANDLGLEIFKIDLSSVVSKYIGETEKNLATIFDEATQSNAILFFDEADALFGKRTEVNDSHDRYANIEVGYLLQRLETYDGIGILATNLRQNIDEAFTRRMDFLVDFPFPEPEFRERIWRVSFPANAPLSNDIDFATLAERYRLSGGNIKNSALAAAFFAASEESEIAMRHVLMGIRREYQKMGKLLEDGLALDYR